MSPNFFFFEIVLAILCPLHFHMNGRISLLMSIKKAARILIGIALESIAQFGEY